MGQDRKNAEARGAAARSPLGFTPAAWWAILKRIWTNSGQHDLALLASAVAFYAFLSFVPLLGALVMAYGLIADPAAVGEHMRVIVDLVPAAAADLIYEQLTQLTLAAADRKGVGLLVALLVSVYGASRAASAMIRALNIIYEQEDRRSWLAGLLVAAALAGAAVLIAGLGIAAASVLTLAGELAQATGPSGALAVQLSTWCTAAVLCSLALSALYRFAPHRADARWQWLSLGGGLATLLWLAATLGFGLYALYIGRYDATYGSLGAVVVLLMWLYVSAYAILLGALVNAEAERQTAIDTTTGPPEPLGRRGATMADTSAALD